MYIYIFIYIYIYRIIYTYIELYIYIYILWLHPKLHQLHLPKTKPSEVHGSSAGLLHKWLAPPACPSWPPCGLRPRPRRYRPDPPAAPQWMCTTGDLAEAVCCVLLRFAVLDFEGNMWEHMRQISRHDIYRDMIYIET